MDYIDQVFGEGGLLSQRFKGYEPRKGQVALARATHEAILGGENVLAEAPTGTGKSIAYSVPAVWWASRDNPDRDTFGEKRQRVLLVTANIALQEQLIGKDLPMLAELLPWPFTFALAKGRGNYLCLDRFEENVADMILAPLTDPTEREQWRIIDRWAGTTTTGDVSELPFEPMPKLRALFTTSTDDCTGKACPRYADCHAEHAKKKVADADVIVTNYHLLFAHIAVQMSSDGTAAILPEYDAVVFDEGHKAADIARDFFGFRITPHAVRYAARLLAPAQGKASRKQEVMLDPLLKARIGELADDYFGALRVYFHGDTYEARLKETNAVPSEELEGALAKAVDLYTKASEDPHYTSDRRADLRNIARRAALIAFGIKGARELSNQDEVVYFIEEDAKERVSLNMKPIHVADVLRAQLFESEKVRSVTVTSATMVSSGTFDYIASELGAEDAEELVAPSPFDWGRQALLVIPTGMPMPTEQRFADAVAARFLETVELANGRTLGLFTSYRMLDHVHKHLMRSGWQGRVLRHGTAPRTQLIRQFQEDVGSVLLGTESFWQGVDVPGEACSCVVIDRLPFPSPDDPILSALEDREGSRVFKTYSMPRAIIAFRQGFGRLVRTVTDRGVVVVLDRRIVDKPYGRSFLRALPGGTGMTRNMDAIPKFIAGVGVPAEPMPERKPPSAAQVRRAAR